jgi:hypothetical protein
MPYQLSSCIFITKKEKASSPYNRPTRPRSGVEMYLYSFFNLGARLGWVVNITPRPLVLGKKPVLTVWDPGPA